MKNDLRQFIANAIRNELERQNISQSELARRLGWSVGSVNNACNTRKPVSLDVVNDIFSYLQIELGYRSNAEEA